MEGIVNLFCSINFQTLSRFNANNAVSILKNSGNYYLWLTDQINSVPKMKKKKVPEEQHVRWN